MSHSDDLAPLRPPLIGVDPGGPSFQHKSPPAPTDPTGQLLAYRVHEAVGFGVAQCIDLVVVEQKRIGNVEQLVAELEPVEGPATARFDEFESRAGVGSAAAANECSADGS